MGVLDQTIRVAYETSITHIVHAMAIVIKLACIKIIAEVVILF